MHVAQMIQDNLRFSKSFMNTSDNCIELKTGVAENVIHSNSKTVLLTRSITNFI